ncbi:uncharacterized protein PFL1_00764 [Pseudozyma flocculosa PF-1]|uniref:uncharacterized protein n=1 Tax=Pseudozyma flocculosa PF-1 TaxID=1277687 RepID=UPI0004561B9A|nr:uncharacterized protein PFL1_00764 [Pseudozyma flocculosa PF-1]EPQ31429.1 hypothetical protein PFL1_00764 [Pseudozyma flocculosa PF-1]
MSHRDGFLCHSWSTSEIPGSGSSSPRWLLSPPGRAVWTTAYRQHRSCPAMGRRRRTPACQPRGEHRGRPAASWVAAILYRRYGGRYPHSLPQDVGGEIGLGCMAIPVARCETAPRPSSCKQRRDRVATRTVPHGHQGQRTVGTSTLPSLMALQRARHRRVVTLLDTQNENDEKRKGKEMFRRALGRDMRSRITSHRRGCWGQAHVRAGVSVG